jgi:hypothetical protein
MVTSSVGHDHKSERWQGSVPIVRVNCRSALSSERAPHIIKLQMSEDNFCERERKIGRGSQTVARYQDRLAD